MTHASTVLFRTNIVTWLCATTALVMGAVRWWEFLVTLVLALLFSMVVSDRIRDYEAASSEARRYTTH